MKLKYFTIRFLGALALASCKKEFTCTCTATADIMGVVTTSSASTTIKDTKKKAKDACDEGDQAETAGVTVDCEIE